MVRLRSIEYSDAVKIVSWNEKKNESFLYQWAGKKAYKFPLSVDQIIKRNNEENIEIYMIDIDGEVVGTIELGKLDRKKKSMRFGRLLISGVYRGKGFGSIAIKLIEDKAFIEKNASYLELGVYEFNIKAKSLYERLGYKVVETLEDSADVKWNSHTMVKSR